MPITRLIFVQFSPEMARRAAQNWKENCAPLMIRQPGCMSEELLQCTDNPGEMISSSQWEDEKSIENYLESDDHKEIKRHNQNITNAKVTVKHYQLVS